MKFKLMIAVCVGLFSALSAVAQNDETVKIAGIILDADNGNGALRDVAIFNKNQRRGTISNEKGRFVIEMRQNDTIVFSTVQHMDEEFFFGKDRPFVDQVLSIQLKTDTIWLNTISVMGNGNFQDFKRELLALEIPENNQSLALPIVNRYAEQYSTGEAAIRIHGPLTYLSKKISAWKKRGSKAAKE